MNDYNDMSDLEGKRVHKILIGDSNAQNIYDEPVGALDILAFETDRGTVAFIVDGDCCSISWFADLNGLDHLRGFVVTAAETIEMPEGAVLDKRQNSEEDEAYGFKLTTERGIADIVFRNSSNGYYGGEMRRYAEALPENMREITENDWRAA